MRLRNSFPPEIRNLYLYSHECEKCGSNQMLELHHILGRISDSAFNACLLCHKCHDAISRKEAPLLFGFNMNFLQEVGYRPSPEDYDFLNSHARELGVKK